MLLIAAGIVLALVVGGIVFFVADEDNSFNAVMSVLVTAMIWVGVVGFVLMITFFFQSDNIVRMTAFYDTNQGVYADAVSLVKEGVESSDGVFDAANLEQVRAYAAVVAAQTEAVVEYNEDLAYQRRWEKALLAGIFFPDAPERLVPLSVR